MTRWRRTGKKKRTGRLGDMVNARPPEVTPEPEVTYIRPARIENRAGHDRTHDQPAAVEDPAKERKQ